MKILKYITLFFIFSSIVLFGFEYSRVASAEKKTNRIKQVYLNSNALSLDTIPGEWIEILLKIEDPNFYSHDGIDVSTPGAGLTTITQGLTKFMYFEKFRPGFAKLEQSLIAKFVVDKHFSKEEQLEVLFNHAYLGHFQGQKIIGFSNASRTYFGKSFSELTKNEYISLVAMLIGPNGVHVIKKPEENRLRVHRIEQVLAGKYKPKSVTDIQYSANGA